ncbi:type IV secretory system conjugative DNA transfer family protein [Thermogemmatispora tikiterensis]|uniref:Helicase HerA central domain-containing protein n=1 Tax=Thermogemmatispora tikiterensis TaxID=1825093 RepID=A0A328VEJ2_9CHLR|nr:hypothetical protein [Thermogemmatispora tikiterensis]RAQ95947.1 hypothetical protein A4R35_10410 [Thermogemmatispora tikiterensis]
MNTSLRQKEMALAWLIPSDDLEGQRQAQAVENWLQASASEAPFALELVGTRQAQGFLLRSRSWQQLQLLCRQLEALAPQVEVRYLSPARDPLRLRPGEQALIGSFGLLAPSYLPIKTFPGKLLKESGADPLPGLLAAMATVGPGQRVIAQVALARAPDDWVGGDLRKTVEPALQAEREQHIRQAHSVRSQHQQDVTEGVRLLALVGAAVVVLLASRWWQTHAWLPLLGLGLLSLITGLGWLWWWLTHASPPIYDQRAVAEKLSRVGFYAQVRMIIIGPATAPLAALTQVLRSLEAAYRQFTQPSCNGFVLKQIRHIRASDRHQAQQLPDVESAFPHGPLRRLLYGGVRSPWILNALEVAGLFHLPQPETDLPLVRRSTNKALLLSPALAQQLLRHRHPFPPALLGYSTQRGYRIPVALPAEGILTHTFVVGKSRSGKSVLMQLIARALLHSSLSPSSPGLVVLDPHRDLVEHLLDQVPPARQQDVLLLDLMDTSYPVAINPLDVSLGLSPDELVANLMSCFERIWNQQWGPRMAYFLTAALRLLTQLNAHWVSQGQAEEQCTLLDINPLLQDRSYAVQLLAQLDLSQPQHQELVQFWQTTYWSLHPSFRNEICMPIVSKIGMFREHEQLRRIVGQPVTQAPLHEAITAGKLVLCALASRELPEGAVNILGSTLLNLLHRAFRLQQSLRLDQRRKVLVAVDEFHTFSGADFERLLSEDAKYGCALQLSTQSLKRLSLLREGLLELVLANCQQLFIFGVSASDALLLEGELHRQVSAAHLVRLPPLHCYGRLSVPGFPQQVISLQVQPPTTEEALRGQTSAAIRAQQHRRQRPAAEVDQWQAEQSRRRHPDVLLTSKRVQREAERVQQQAQQQEAALRIEEEQRTRTRSRPQEPPGDEPFLGPGRGAAVAVASLTEQPGSEPAVSVRKHRRSRRQRRHKVPVGTPPPDPQEQQSQPVTEGVLAESKEEDEDW